MAPRSEARTLAKGEQTRTAVLAAAIARFGRELGVPTPFHDTITTLIKGVEASWS